MIYRGLKRRRSQGGSPGTFLSISSTGRRSARRLRRVRCWSASAKVALLSDPLFGELFHFAIEIGFAFKADTNQVRHRHIALLDTYAVREAAIGLEQIRV